LSVPGTFEDRAAGAIASVAGADGPVVVVAHSLGAAYGPIVAGAIDDSILVYLCPAPTGLLAGEAGGVSGTRPEFPFPAVDEERVSRWPNAEAASDAMYGCLPPGLAQELASALKPDAPAAGDYPLTQNPDRPTELVYATEDEFFFPEWSRAVARERLGVEPIEMRGGHFPMAEQPAELAAVLDGIVTRTG
jgi:pimeloyl-ACP methyl ester carboxylesterase